MSRSSSSSSSRPGRHRVGGHEVGRHPLGGQLLGRREVGGARPSARLLGAALLAPVLLGSVLLGGIRAGGVGLGLRSAAADTPAPGCQPGLGVGLAEVPSNTTDPRARNYIVDHVAPGATFTRRFQVCNGTAVATAVQLYAAGAVITGGGFSVLEGQTGNELSRWITISPSQATIAPGGRLIATATFAVPRSAVIGERYAALLAEVAAPPNKAGVRLLQRAGVRVYLDAGPGGDPVSDFAVDSLQAQRRTDGATSVLAVVHNIGKRAVDLHGTLQLSGGPGGLNAGPFAAQLGTTLKPGDSAPVTFVLNKVITGGPWHAVVDLISGQLDRKAAAELSFSELPGASGAAVQAQALLPYQDRKVLIPIAAGLVLLLAVLLALLASRVISVPRLATAA